MTSMATESEGSVFRNVHGPEPTSHNPSHHKQLKLENWKCGHFEKNSERWLISDDDRKIFVMIGSLLVFGSSEHHSKLTEEMYIPLRQIPKGDSLRCWRFYKLGNQQKLADQSTQYMEGIWAECTLLEKG